MPAANVSTVEQRRLVEQAQQIPVVAIALQVFKEAAVRAPFTPARQPVTTLSTTTNDEPRPS